VLSVLPPFRRWSACAASERSAGGERPALAAESQVPEACKRHSDEPRAGVKAVARAGVKNEEWAMNDEEARALLRQMFAAAIAAAQPAQCIPPSLARHLGAPAAARGRLIVIGA